MLEHMENFEPFYFNFKKKFPFRNNENSSKGIFQMKYYIIVTRIKVRNYFFENNCTIRN